MRQKVLKLGMLQWIKIMCIKYMNMYTNVSNIYWFANAIWKPFFKKRQYPCLTLWISVLSLLHPQGALIQASETTIVPLADVAARVFLVWGIKSICQSKHKAVHRQRFLIYPPIDKNSDLTRNWTHVLQCKSQTFGPPCFSNRLLSVHFLIVSTHMKHGIGLAFNCLSSIFPSRTYFKKQLCLHIYQNYLITWSWSHPANGFFNFVPAFGMLLY